MLPQVKELLNKLITDLYLHRDDIDVAERYAQQNQIHKIETTSVVFPLAFCLYSISCIHFVNETVILNKLRAFLIKELLREKNEDSWNYWREHFQKDMDLKLPNDIDDTGLALLALYSARQNLKDEYFLKLLKNRNSKGIFKTWITDSKGFKADIDLTINLNILALLSEVGLNTDCFEKIVLSKFKTAQFKSNFYEDNIFALLYLTRYYRKTNSHLVFTILKARFKPENGKGFQNVIINEIIKKTLNKYIKYSRSIAKMSFESSLFCKDFPYNGSPSYTYSKYLSYALVIEYLCLFQDDVIKTISPFRNSLEFFTWIFKIIEHFTNNKKEFQKVSISALEFLNNMYSVCLEYDNAIDNHKSFAEESMIYKKVFVVLNRENLKLRLCFGEEINLQGSIKKNLRNIKNPRIESLKYIVFRMSPLFEIVEIVMKKLSINERIIDLFIKFLKQLVLLMQLNDDIADIEDDFKNNNETHLTYLACILKYSNNMITKYVTKEANICHIRSRSLLKQIIHLEKSTEKIVEDMYSVSSSYYSTLMPEV